MSFTAVATPNLLNDPGVLFRAPIGSTLPTNTVAGSVFTDTWPIAWVQLGMTDTGSEWDTTTNVSPVNAAETLDPIAYRTTDRSGQVMFMLKSFTATNLAQALNGAVTTVTGAAATTLTQIDPVTLGQEVRSMIGWESQDSTVRMVAFQVINSGTLKFAMAKAPSTAQIPWTAMMEKPSATQPYRIWTAGVGRA